MIDRSLSCIFQVFDILNFVCVTINNNNFVCVTTNNINFVRVTNNNNNFVRVTTNNNNFVCVTTSNSSSLFPPFGFLPLAVTLCKHGLYIF